ncbi:Ulp1 protease family, carboxy-terminal catalytic domain protein [Ceratobasidium sp. AG-Ba]|nr:Ulp1 protease family, carboxy-terminal catalytic domain protein [Ceratobasidium sp. AG-Ba]
MKADNLFATHACLIKGLLDSGVCVSFANSVEDFVIPHPEPGFKPHTISLRFYDPKHTPIAVIQDSKHLAKTLHNVLFSGTHSLIIGNCVLHYQQILALSKHQDSPIFARDVTKVDRQDDLAALRLFSSATLKLVFQIIDEQKSALKPDPILSKDLTGLSIYLFVFGELIDVLHNRFMPIETRCKNVFRAYHFLEIWAASLDTLKYPKSAYFITREAREIIQYLVDGFISLVLIYRDHLDHGNYPLMPWLHSTKPCEHTFGEARKLESDITVSNFIYIQGKLKALFDAAVLSGEYANANARAAGYFHTEYSDRGIDIAALSSYPTSSIICESSNLGFYEAKALFALCGIPVTNDLVPPNKTIRSTFLRIDQWLPNDDEEIESRNAYMEPACEMYAKPAGVTAEFHQIFQAEGARPLGALRLEDKRDLYSCAAVALEFDNQNKIDALPDFDTEIAWQQLREQLTRDIPGFPLPPLGIVDEVLIPPSNLSQCETNVDNLVAIRVSNETEFAKKKKAVRIGAFVKDNSTTDPARETKKSHLVGQKILAKIHETLREIQKTVGSGTGAARKIHHGQEPASLTQAGNAANAAIVAKERGVTAMKTCVQKLKDAGVKCIDIVAGAGVSGIAPVRTGSFAVVLTEDQLWLAEVLTMYSKSAGKGGNHGWVDSETNVSQLSYILVQLWEHWSDREFRSVVKTTASYHAYRFAHIPSQRLLYVSLPSSIEYLSSEKLRVGESLYKIWSAIAKDKLAISNAVKEMLHRVRNPALQGQTE